MQPHFCRHDAVLGFGRHHIRHAQKQGKLTIPLQSKQVRCCSVLRVQFLSHHRALPQHREALPFCSALLPLQGAAGTPWTALAGS